VIQASQLTTKPNEATQGWIASPLAAVRLAGVAAALVLSLGSSNSANAQAVMQDSTDVILNDRVPRQVREVTVDQKLGGKIPLNLPLRDSTGKMVKTGYFFDGSKPTIITLNYSDCPMLCNVQLNQLTKTLRETDLVIGEDFNILTVSIDPKETLEKIAATKDKYVQQLTSAQPNADKGWAFCTTSQPVITELADSLGFRYRYDANSGEYYHAAMLAFVSPAGVITRYSLSVDFPVNDLRKALVESGEGTVGTTFDQAMLWCFQFDPNANSYTLVGRKVMYFGGLLFVAGLFAMLAPFWFNARNRSRTNPDALALGNGEVPSARLTKQTQLFQTRAKTV
jgi:protein SCO1